jgi:hypothetical protein
LKALDKLLQDATAGDPITGLKWTRKTCRKLAKELKRKGYQVEHSTIPRLVRLLKYTLRANQKRLSRKKDKRRDEQMKYIEGQRKRFARKKQPEISVDGKKKEKIGQFRNPGRTLRRKPLDVLATDFLTDAIGKASLYGIYDILRNVGFVAVGVSHETAEFAAATIRRWLLKQGRLSYKDCTDLLIQVDSGGSNACNSWLWKVELQKLADEFQLAITVTHYPPGTSKWNLIEHRMFSVISQNWAGQPLVSYETVLKFIRTSTTETGFHCTAYFDRKHYETKRKVTPEEKANVNLHPHKLFPAWNYTIRPNPN